jgi:hypothetical protein
MLKDLANRVLPPTYRHPDPPVSAGHWAPSFLMSVDDDVRPTPRLVHVALAAADAAARQAGEGLEAWPDDSGRFLDGLIATLKPTKVVRIGTGGSESKVEPGEVEAADLIYVPSPVAPEAQPPPAESFARHPSVPQLTDMRFRDDALILLDGIWLWPMLEFWRALPWPKLDVTSFASWTGAGLVEPR